MWARGRRRQGFFKFPNQGSLQLNVRGAGTLLFTNMCISYLGYLGTLEFWFGLGKLDICQIGVILTPPGNGNLRLKPHKLGVSYPLRGGKQRVYYYYYYTLFLPRGKVRLQTSCGKGCQNPTPCWTRQIQARPNQPWARCSVFIPPPASRGHTKGLGG